MASKQEKLAAARRKLKEFQGKQRESDNVKQKNVPEVLLPKSNVDSSQLSVQLSSQNCTPVIDENNKLDYDDKQVVQNYAGESIKEPARAENFKTPLKSSDIYIRPIELPASWTGGIQCNDSPSKEILQSTFPHADCNMQYKSVLEAHADDTRNHSPMSSVIESININNNNNNNSSSNSVPHIVDDKNGYQLMNTRSSAELEKDKSASVTPEIDFKRNFTQLHNIIVRDNSSIPPSEPRNFNSGNFMGNNSLDDIIKPLQTELQNHAQTINILVQQRNEAQNALTHAQNLLSEKSEEIVQQKQQLINLNVTVKDLNNRLSESDLMTKNLHKDNEITKQQVHESFTSYQTLKSQYDSKEEECLELRRKYEDKNKECQQLMYSLSEAQSQLSLCQIQIQNQFQPVTDEKAALIQRLSIIENDNINLSQQMENLKAQLESASVENELSSQKFKIYAQQCNVELNALNSQLKEISKENEKLKQMNAALPSMPVASDVEKPKESDTSWEEYKSEIADLHIQISDLREGNNVLQKNYQKLENLNVELRTELDEKDVELKNALSLLKDAEVENKKLLLEVETPKANEKLLAAIESDKVAAAKAVSQNQKLKSQVMELEEAFVKLSEEKLELTDKLSHEKHVNKELQSRLEVLESCPHSSDTHEHNHQHHYNHDDHSHAEHDGECSSIEKEEPLVNDSQEIDELKRIIRQLQDDKMELKSRLSLLTPLDDGQGKKHIDDSEPISEEDAKVRLQQMEEKVRKTMNEIAILDEEKEKLEHLVLQLQGETETIGEYITLYQKQRMVLKQRAQEKDNQLIQLSKDRDELKSKLHDLDDLVQHLLRERNGGGTAPPDSNIVTVETPGSEMSENTAGKIRALISEIGSTNLVNSQSVAFKHCSCCSGRLITI